ncbi:hypothetical protein LRLP16767_LR202_02162 [Limosilactobacillus reuteri]|uniref:Uncharacterized protein n=1 Tax=Limosilactobacillus reuteri TaxID=1598 RepID=A0A0U5K2P3_LIMRT|nr:hypothetical protein LRLP16767_LR202_02162 [Limosilactobacillus reuteri]
MIGKTNEQRITNAEQRQLDKELSKLDLQTNKEYSELFLHILKLKNINL